jgi:hypothetical protein
MLYIGVVDGIVYFIIEKVINGGRGWRGNVPFLLPL